MYNEGSTAEPKRRGPPVTARSEELYNQALRYMEKWELDKAEEVLRQLLDEDPQHARALNKLGVIFARRKDLQQAEMCFNEALALDPSLASAHSNLGNIYAERGWHARAKAAYEQALLLEPDNSTALHNLGVLYRKSGDIAKGVSLLKEASRAERRQMRGELKANPEKRRVVQIGWIIIAIIFFVLLYLANR